MTIEDCYAALSGNYNEVIGRLRSEALVRRFVIKFLSDASGPTLFETMAAKNYTDAFRAAHTLKGVCQNLGFTALGNVSSAITEALREGDTAGAEKLLPEVKEAFDKTVSAIKAYEAEG